MIATKHVEFSLGGESRDAVHGMTLVEVVISMALMTIICTGLISSGIKAQQFAEHDRLAAEARAFAKAHLEQMVAKGWTSVSDPLFRLLSPATNVSSLGDGAYTIVLKPQILWHAASGVVTQESAASYAEAWVDAAYFSPLFRRSVTDAFVVVMTE